MITPTIGMLVIYMSDEIKTTTNHFQFAFGAGGQKTDRRT
jgi:hypothetical protein